MVKIYIIYIFLYYRLILFSVTTTESLLFDIITLKIVLNVFAIPLVRILSSKPVLNKKQVESKTIPKGREYLLTYATQNEGVSNYVLVAWPTSLDYNRSAPTRK